MASLAAQGRCIDSECNDNEVIFFGIRDEQQAAHP